MISSLVKGLRGSPLSKRLDARWVFTISMIVGSQSMRVPKMSKERALKAVYSGGGIVSILCERLGEWDVCDGWEKENSERTTRVYVEEGNEEAQATR